MWLNGVVFLICSRILSSRSSAFVVDISVLVIAPVSASPAFVVDISVVAIGPVFVVVDIAGKLRVRGTVDIPRLMMVFVLSLSLIGVNVGASIPTEVGNQAHFHSAMIHDES